MDVARFDLRGLAVGQGPSRRHVASVVDTTADGLLVVQGPVPALAAVLARLWKTDRLAAVTVGWEPVDGDAACRGLARDLGLGSGTARELPLVRDDHGGVLLHHGRIESPGGRALRRRFGAQAHHDDARVADGAITRIEARPLRDPSRPPADALAVTVVVAPMRTRRSTGRALQVACDPARVLRDGVPLDREVQRWTWYADDRVHWRLQP